MFGFELVDNRLVLYSGRLVRLGFVLVYNCEQNIVADRLAALRHDVCISSKFLVTSDPYIRLYGMHRQIDFTKITAMIDVLFSVKR